MLTRVPKPQSVARGHKVGIYHIEFLCSVAGPWLDKAHDFGSHLEPFPTLDRKPLYKEMHGFGPILYDFEGELLNMSLVTCFFGLLLARHYTVIEAIAHNIRPVISKATCNVYLILHQYFFGGIMPFGWQMQDKFHTYSST